jgi:hypothetical protein
MTSPLAGSYDGTTGQESKKKPGVNESYEQTIGAGTTDGCVIVAAGSSYADDVGSWAGYSLSYLFPKGHVA